MAFYLHPPTLYHPRAQKQSLKSVLVGEVQTLGEPCDTPGKLWVPDRGPHAQPGSLCLGPSQTGP